MNSTIKSSKEDKAVQYLHHKADNNIKQLRKKFRGYNSHKSRAFKNSPLRYLYK